MLNFVPRTLWRSLPALGELPINDGQVFHVGDTLPATIAGAEGEVLNPLLWQSQNFAAVCDKRADSGDASIRFPSPLPQGRAAWDTVVLDWHIARDSRRQFTQGPAVLVLDILKGGNLVSGYIAKTLAKNGIHGFVMHLPQNGRRRLPEEKDDWTRFIPSLRQAAGDARRGRDVIAALPLVSGPICLQGTSLGGFVATLAGSIDSAFHTVLLALTGGDVYGVLTRGKMDAARVHANLLAAGYGEEQLRRSLWQIEPLRVAHRLNPRRTWLFSARFDQVIRPSHGRRLAAAIGLDWQHHRQLAGCHYTCALGARRFLGELVAAIPRRLVSSQTAGISTAGLVSPVPA